MPFALGAPSLRYIWLFAGKVRARGMSHGSSPGTGCALHIYNKWWTTCLRHESSTGRAFFIFGVCLCDGGLVLRPHKAGSVVHTERRRCRAKFDVHLCGMRPHTARTTCQVFLVHVAHCVHFYGAAAEQSV